MAKHEHSWPGDLTPDSICEVPGCGLRYNDWSEDDDA